MPTSRHPQTLGVYEILDVLGQGGMGAVYRARHGQLGTVRAVKVMLSKRDPRKTMRFLREARNLARIRHPNVVAIHDVGQGPDGQAFFAMDLVDGQPLDDLLKERRPSVDEAVRLAIGLAEGVGALHAQGVLHRDLKPANVLIAADGRPVVLDLGLAIDPESDERLTRTGAVIGTLLYMSPEQLHGREATPASDVFSMGLILFELLTGERPTESEGSPILGVSRVVKNRPRPSDVNREVPLALDAVFLQTIAADPGQRPQDASQLAELLRAAAARPGPTRARRRALRWVAGGVSALLLVTAGALGLSVATGADDPPPQEAPVEQAPETPEVRELTPRQIERGRSTWRNLRGLPPRELHAGAETWLADYPGHELEGEVRAARKRAQLGFPLRTFPEDPWVSLGPTGPLSLSAKSLRAWTVDPLRVEAEIAIEFTPRRLLARPDSELVLVLDDGGVLHGYQLPDLRPQPTHRVEGRQLFMSLGPGGRAVLGAGGPKNTIPCYQDLQAGETRTFPEQQSRIYCVSSNGKALLVTSGGDLGKPGVRNAVAIYDLESQKALLDIGHFNRPTAAQLSADGRTYLIGDAQGQLAVFDATTGEPTQTFRAANSSGHFEDGVDNNRAHPVGIRDLTWLADGRILSCAAWEHVPDSFQIRLWSPDGRLLHSLDALPNPPQRIFVPEHAAWFLLRNKGAVNEVWKLPPPGEDGLLR